MERIVNRLRTAEQRLEWLFRKLEDALNRIRFAEQRVREVAGQPGLAFPAAFDPGTVLGVAKVTTAITVAGSRTTPGAGKIKLYTSFDGTTLGDLGDEYDCFNINIEHGIKLNATVQAKKVLGVWWVDTPDACADLS